MEYTALPLVAALVSVLVQVIKATAGTSRYVTIALVCGLSLLGGAAYAQLADTQIWQSALQVLLYANAVYGFLIKSFED